MEKNCENCYCLYNKNCLCTYDQVAMNKFGFCESMIVLNKEINHKIYKFKMVGQ